MKKTISLLLVAAMICSMGVTTAFATTDAANGTTITYSNENAAYTVTVPASLAPGESGTVTATGLIGDTQKLVVTADTTVSLVNGSQSTDVAITFPGIEMVGNNLEQTATATVAVGDVQQAMFGTWTGILTYNVEFDDGEVDMINFTIDGVSCQAEEGMTWGKWLTSDYDNIGLTQKMESSTSKYLVTKQDTGKTLYEGSTKQYQYMEIKADTAYISQ